MKKLRFLGIMVGVVMMWMESIVAIKAEGKSCYNVKTYMVGDLQEYGGGDYASYYRFDKTESTIDEVKDGSSFCDIKLLGTIGGGMAGTEKKDYYIAAIRKCSNGELSKDLITCGEDQVCLNYKHQSTGIREAYCYNSKGCLYGVDGASYYDDSVFGNANLVSMSTDFKFDLDGELACFEDNGNSVVKKCRTDTGSWESTGTTCTAKQSCIMYKANKATAMNAYCESDCSGPDGKNGEAVCVKENGVSKIKVCNASKWTETSMSTYFNNSSCNDCVQSVSGPTCVKVEDNGQYTAICNQIKTENKTESVNNGAVGDYICDSSGTLLYKCDDGATDGYYTFVKDCSKESEGLVKCGIKKGSKVATCISKTDFENNDQSVVTSQVTVEVTTDDGFFCDGGNGIRTAFGCIPYSMSGLAEKLLPILFGIAGGISFLLMVFGFIMMATSSGDEKKLIEARSRITSAITGLVVSIFAIFLFRLIFSNILKIPGL